ncbi:NtaA/DmoA family FMN-dependent monooxygenase [Ancylobacter dichloromethanicus]|uniref:Dibenzothiophene desulfurization enzyme A n=1 Tax=Ancylobacter dichloromethanicus TaxID=518825 RepID=A0A9W6J902_9HYPH|nr:NtaA/DmoA family FMN-dependent monooxygenase [Ancylobacter dichloromethanicus]MBS7553328.1 NtaA/DmoA family FMN-dependent monooxygenase [Ancylobacter dichloromethanicus]GLK73111.1 dibenzothiophene desulfurization enzyme A [Ancylobacter dichloromethanicus]
MADKRFHLAWFMNFTPDEWREPFGQGGNPWDGRFYIEMAQAMERACFDLIMIEDKLMVPETYGRSRDLSLKHAMMVPKADPAPLAVAMGMATQHLGVVATLSTMAYPPFMLARLSSTIDSLTKGRFGWNVVTSAEDLMAKNFGMDKLPPREDRYAMAEEYMEVVGKLFDSWEPDAVVLDRKNGIYADGSKVHAIDHKGPFYQVRGPLNTVPSPQRRPVYLQAGASPRGRDFAARHADAIVSVANGVEGMKAFRADIRARAAALGRDPDEIKVFFCITPSLGETEAEARARYEHVTMSDNFVTDVLISISAITEIDFSIYDLDKPLPEKLVTNGESGTLDKFQQWGSGKTLRELAASGGGGLVSSMELIGTPAQVADKMGEAMAEVGGDGFLITTPVLRVSRRYITEICDGLVPELQARGLVRTEYKHQLLRDNLREF